jgi:hypothetical protein
MGPSLGLARAPRGAATSSLPHHLRDPCRPHRPRLCLLPGGHLDVAVGAVGHMAPHPGGGHLCLGCRCTAFLDRNTSPLLPPEPCPLSRRPGSHGQTWIPFCAGPRGGDTRLRIGLLLARRTGHLWGRGLRECRTGQQRIRSFLPPGDLRPGALPWGGRGPPPAGLRALCPDRHLLGPVRIQRIREPSPSQLSERGGPGPMGGPPMRSGPPGVLRTRSGPPRPRSLSRRTAAAAMLGQGRPSRTGTDGVGGRGVNRPGSVGQSPPLLVKTVQGANRWRRKRRMDHG